MRKRSIRMNNKLRPEVIHFDNNLIPVRTLYTLLLTPFLLFIFTPRHAQSSNNFIPIIIHNIILYT